MKNQLTHTEQAFINEYLKNGFNGTRAYLAIKPKVKQSTALAGIYTQDTQPMDGYVDLLKTLVIVQGDVNVNNQDNTSNKEKVIDATCEKKDE